MALAPTVRRPLAQAGRSPVGAIDGTGGIGRGDLAPPSRPDCAPGFFGVDIRLRLRAARL